MTIRDVPTHSGSLVWKKRWVSGAIG